MVQKRDPTVVNHNYSRRSYQTQGYRSFSEFYPFYLGEHCNQINRRLHLIGTTIVIGIILYGLITTTWKLLLLSPVPGYGMAWIGHFCFEKNKPATFKNPFYSVSG